MNKKVNIVFPCAGSGQRFGGVFKPFLKIGDLTFIEKAFQPFKKWNDYIDKIYFLVTYAQEEDHEVFKNLITMFDKEKVNVLFLEKPTTGPLQTFIKTYIRSVASNNSFIVCDCDHSIDVDEIFKMIISNDQSDVIIPTWKIKNTEQENWSKILLKNNKIYNFVNKEDVDLSIYDVRGIIGCIYFKNYEYFLDTNNEKEFYQIIKKIFNNKGKINFSKPKNAYFFGDKNMLKNCIEKRRNECTVFCDIDGVLLEHKDHSTNLFNKNAIIGDIEILKRLSLNNHKVVLTTARSKKYKDKLKKMLKKFNIHYDELLMGLPSGPRILINDRKPKKYFTKQANSYELLRNKGLHFLENAINNIVENNKIKILKDMSANSFAKTYYMKKENKKLVRKHIFKTNENKKHVDILKRQKNDIERLNFLSFGLSPKIENEEDNNLEYYYDMEYLENYSQLSNLDNENINKILDKLLDVMKNDIYSLNKKVDGKKWIDNFLNEKIYPKFKTFEKINNEFFDIINSSYVSINGKKYFGLKKVFNTLDFLNLFPKNISVIHGDLTLENILVKNNKFKLIDTDGSRLFDAKELDLGKLSQSILSNYSEWKNNISEIKKIGNNYICDDSFFLVTNKILANNLIKKWCNITLEEKNTVLDKAIFYMATYFIRFVPFRLQLGKNHGMFALIMATVWLNKLIGEKNEYKNIL